MISKRIEGRKDGRSSARAALRYGEGISPNRETGEFLDKSHRTRLGNFGLVDDGVYIDRDLSEKAELIELASIEMQSNCELNTRVAPSSHLAHLIFSFNQVEPSEAVLRDTEDSALAALGLSDNHFASFLHNDNGYWHLHVVASRIEKGTAHRCADLWQDKTKRDKVCREIEQRHGLPIDNGLHQIDDQGRIVEVPRAERRAKREQKPFCISNEARTKEAYSGEKSFQTWAIEIRIGDRLKHAKSWKELHETAAAFGCEVKPKGAGFVICPTGEKGGIQLSKVGVKNLPARYGAFIPNAEVSKDAPTAQYTPAPTKPQAANLYEQWRKARDAFKTEKIAVINEQREAQKQSRADLRVQHKNQLAQIRASASVHEKTTTISIAKMEQAAMLSQLAEKFAAERHALRQRLADIGPGNTFRDYLVKQAARGDETALALAQRYGADESTSVTHEREANQLKLVAGLAGKENRSGSFPAFQYQVIRTGTVVFNLGGGRIVTDSHAARMVQLNNLAADDPRAVEVALRFAVSKFGTSLNLTGSPEFQRLAVETAVRKGLGVRFADPALESYRQEFAATQRQRFTPSFTQRKESHVSHLTKQHPGQIPPAHRRDRLHFLSDGDVVLNTFGNVMPLQQNVLGRLVQQQQEKPHHRMQRPAASALGARSAGVTPPPATSTSDNKPAPEALPAKPLPAYQLPAGVEVASPDYQGRGSVSLVPGFVIQSRGRSLPVAIPLSAFSVEQLEVVRAACVPSVAAGAVIQVSLSGGQVKAVIVSRVRASGLGY